MADEVEIGRVNDYFAHINVAGIDLTAPLKVGDRVRGGDRVYRVD